MSNLKDVLALLESASRGIEPTHKLVMGLTTGKLAVSPVPDPNNSVATGMAAPGFFGGRFIVSLEKDTINIIPKSDGKAEVSVETMHISCKSDTYEPGHNYGGVIIYQSGGKSEWRTANNTHCKSGYIVIQDTDSKAVKKWTMGPDKEPGKVHGAIYRNAFGESVKEKEVVGEGFALRRNGEFEISSKVFNNPPNSEYHDYNKRMHKFSGHCVRKIVECWKTAGPRWVRQRNFTVKELLEDLDFDINETLY